MFGDELDCLDERNHWMTVEVIAKKENTIKVHYTGYSDKYDEWID